MLTKIKSLKNVAIFRNHRPAITAAVVLKRYNLIYGWNGCGKTSFSRFLSAIETGTSPAYPDLEYTAESSDGTLQNGRPSPRKVRVFNQDYIAENAPCLEDPAATSKHIFILGKENIALAEDIKAKKLKLSDIKSLLSQDDKKAGKISLATQKTDLEKQYDQKFTDVAKVIASSHGRAFRDYNRTHAQKAFAKLEVKQELSSADLESSKKMTEQKLLEKLDLLTVYKTDEEDRPTNTVLDISEELAASFSNCTSLLGETANHTALKRLIENPDIASWIVQGLTIHKQHASDTCEYCGNPLSDHRLEELSGHFNKAHTELIAKIDAEISNLRQIYKALKLTQLADKNSLYEKIQEGYSAAAILFDQERTSLIEEIAKIGKLLGEKKTKTQEQLEIKDISLDSQKFTEAFDATNKIVEEHNKLSANFDQEVKKAEGQLETHFLSTIYDDATADKKKVDELKLEIESKTAEASQLKTEISAEETKIRNTKIALDRINSLLQQFLGRNEIVFEDSEDGYVIKRNGAVADRLSEGEKTAIAFVHFIIALESDEFDLEEGIVVVDDPISSLDSNSIFQAFSFVRTHLSKAHQLFILTHNFDFLRLTLNWLGHRETKHLSSFLMIKNCQEDGGRSAYLDKIDPLLEKHESEYHYLFQKLHQFAVSGDDSIAESYNIPNMARKVLETFLMFRVPTSGESTYTKLNRLDFDDAKKAAVYKFTNDQSHITGSGFNPSLVPESKNNVAHLLGMIEATFPDHYTLIIESFQGTGS